jgi:plasmid stability protein
MKKNTLKQYTIRNIPSNIDQSLKRRAKADGKSFNQVALEALAIGAGQNLKPKRDFTEVIGSLSTKEAENLEKQIQLQQQIDPRLWK